jgi:hypothetical protein
MAGHHRQVAFVGFPRDRIQDYRPAAQQIILAPSLFHTELRGDAPWPSEERYLDERLDCPATVPDFVDGAPAPATETFAEDLQGICGAGVFLMPREEDGWDLTQVPLIGIERGVLTPSRRFVFHNAHVIRRALDVYVQTRPRDWPL